jgi:RNA polymerase sigma-70 factor (ECF subfamily)
MMPFVPWTRSRRAHAAPGTAAADTRCAAGLQALRSGDLRGIDTLYASEAPRVYRYALALCGNPGWAADATQEAFVALALRPAGFDPARGALGAYLAGVARHALAAQWRLAQREEPLPEEEGDDAAQAHTPSPESLLVRAQDGHAVWSALRRLPTPFREALVLVDLQERPYAEAASIAGIELNTLRTRVHRGRRQLAALLNADRGPDPESAP